MATVTRLHACVWAAASIVYFSLASLDATASPAPAATWVKQAPLPTPYDLAGVDMISETEGWAVGEAGTILHTTDGGVTWTEQASGTVEALHAVKFLDASHGWAVGTVMLWTDDGGSSWRQGNAFPASNYGVDFVDLNRGWAVGTGGVVFRTTDGGRNWMPSPTPTSENLKDVDFMSASVGWAVGANGTIIRTTNGGTTWTRQRSRTTAFLDGVSFVSAQEGWAAGGSTILHTTNGGVTWQKQTTPPGTWAYSLKFADALHGWAAGTSLASTIDGGQTWTLQPVANPNWLFGVDFTGPSTGVTVGELGGVFTTGDGGSTWLTRLNGAPTEVYGMDANDSLHAWAAGTFGETQYTVDGGATWSRTRVGNPYGHFYAVDFAADNTRGWLVGDGDQIHNYGVIYRSLDGGKTWTLQLSTGPLDVIYDVAAVGARRAVAVSALGYIRYTTDGRTWRIAQRTGASLLNAVSFTGGTGWVAGNNSTVEMSVDGGRTWVSRSPSPGYNAAFMDVSFADELNGWVVGFYGDVFHTMDGGLTWQRQTVQGAGDTAFLDIEAISPTTAWISGGPVVGFVARTTNGGATWTQETLPDQPLSIAALSFQSADRGWAGGWMGVWRRTGE
jgi:photosystem II stability/assembly factor-like uncharacterized protein